MHGDWKGYPLKDIDNVPGPLCKAANQPERRLRPVVTELLIQVAQLFEVFSDSAGSFCIGEE